MQYFMKIPLFVPRHSVAAEILFILNRGLTPTALRHHPLRGFEERFSDRLLGGEGKIYFIELGQGH